MHSGATCGDVGGHHYDSDLIDATATISTTTPNGADPWWSAEDGFRGPIKSNEMIKGSDVVATGYDLHAGAGYASDVSKYRTVVIHDDDGKKVACSVLSPDATDYGGSKIDGRVTFTNTKPTATVTIDQVDGFPDQTNAIRIDYFFSGLVPGPHKLHVHTLGNVLSADAGKLALLLC